MMVKPCKELDIKQKKVPKAILLGPAFPIIFCIPASGYRNLNQTAYQVTKYNKSKNAIQKKTTCAIAAMP